MNLTIPTLIVFENTLPDDLMSRKYYIEITGYLQEYKEVIIISSLLFFFLKIPLSLLLVSNHRLFNVRHFVKKKSGKYWLKNLENYFDW